jgi:hypothetical protein
LLPAKSPERFDSFRAWLEDYDRGHSYVSGRQGKRPSRLLFVGKPGDTLRIVDSTGGHEDNTRYIALSHCWGNIPKSHRVWCTTKLNLKDRKAGFDFARLPKTFQDAIDVARGLNITYLWIDSLYIVQDDDED